MNRGQRNSYLIEGKRQHTATHLIGTTLATSINFGILYDAGFPLWRIGALALSFLVFMSVQWLIIHRTAHGESLDRSFTIINSIAQLHMSFAATLTGGLHSPFTPSLALGAMLAFIFFGPRRPSSTTMVGLLGVLIAIMAVLPQSALGPPLPNAHYALLAVSTIGWSLFMIHSFLVKLSDATVRATCAISDLRADRVADAEAQARRLQSVGAKVAHELKNPLAAIKGLVQLVARAPESPKTKERLAVVESEVDRMEAILREYLSFARPLEDLQVLPIDLAAITADAASVLSGRLEQGRIAVEAALDPAPLAGDARRLKEALINLLANAIEATPAGGRIRIATMPRPCGGVRLEISDTGRGIRPEDLGRLGTSFFTTRAAGTGLGVVLAVGVIAQHGGAIEIASEHGHGTQVTIELPAEPRQATTTPLTTRAVRARAAS
ncbi:MAG: sensor histidine kinase [Deltaproteobacteria bacterium]|nr:sensor histidine kinase [Deltaproteobacteria bacterium]